MDFISRDTIVKNIHSAPIVLMGMKNGYPIEEFNVTIPGSGQKEVYYSHLKVEYNYSHAYVYAFLEGEEGVRTSVSTSNIRDYKVLEFDYQDGRVICRPPSKRGFFSRIRLFKCFVPGSAIQN